VRLLAIYHIFVGFKKDLTLQRFPQYGHIFCSMLNLILRDITTCKRR
jgi:hypothetical protein